MRCLRLPAATSMIGQDRKVIMSLEKRENLEEIQRIWGEYSERYDRWYERFEGAVEHYVDLELLKAHLPKQSGVSILDAAGGTGRITIPLAREGYAVTLCDISPAMIDIAKRKIRDEGLSRSVEVVECDVRQTHFENESFDFVICWGGVSRSGAKELMRVTKDGGGVSFFLASRFRAAIDSFQESPKEPFDFLRANPTGEQDRAVDGYPQKLMSVSTLEASEFFGLRGLRNIEFYGCCGMLRYLGIPQSVQKATEWDAGLFERTTRMVLRLCKEPSVVGFAKHIVIYGRKGCALPQV